MTLTYSPTADAEQHDEQAEQAFDARVAREAMIYNALQRGEDMELVWEVLMEDGPDVGLLEHLMGLYGGKSLDLDLVDAMDRAFQRYAEREAGRE